MAYLGETYPINQHIEVYYAARDVKRDYKVIGHLSNALITNEESAKKEIIGKAKMVGADGVIFTGFGTTAGKDGSNTATADAIMYTEQHLINAPVCAGSCARSPSLQTVLRAGL